MRFSAKTTSGTTPVRTRPLPPPLRARAANRISGYFFYIRISGLSGYFCRISGYFKIPKCPTLMYMSINSPNFQKLPKLEIFIKNKSKLRKVEIFKKTWNCQKNRNSKESQKSISKNVERITKNQLFEKANFQKCYNFDFVNKHFDIFWYFRDVLIRSSFLNFDFLEFFARFFENFDFFCENFMLGQLFFVWFSGGQFGNCAQRSRPIFVFTKYFVVLGLIW